MSKSMTREQRKNSKYLSWDQDRKNKQKNMMDSEPVPVKPKPKKKWKPHSEIEAD